MHLVRTWVCRVTNCKSLFKFCLYFFDKTYLTYSFNVYSIFSCSNDTENMQGILNPVASSLLNMGLCHSPSFPHIHRIYKEIHWIQYIFRSMPNSFPFSSLHAIAYLPCTSDEKSSSLLTFKISPSLGSQESWKKCKPRTQDWISNVFIITIVIRNEKIVWKDAQSRFFFITWIPKTIKTYASLH